MSVTIKHLNADASFLLSFEPAPPSGASVLAAKPRPFTVLLDPWLTGPSIIFHSKMSTTTHKRPPCIASLRELPFEPDLVVISQHKSDHCNEATLKQLPGAGTGARTLILAEPQSAKLIRSWRHFDRERVITVHRWEDPRLNGGRDTVRRIAVPPAYPGGQPGEVTVAFIPQKRDISRMHAAIGITYRPPSVIAAESQVSEGLGLSKVLTDHEESVVSVTVPPVAATAPPAPQPPPTVTSTIHSRLRSTKSYRSLPRIFHGAATASRPPSIIIPPPVPSEGQQQPPPMLSSPSAACDPTSPTDSTTTFHNRLTSPPMSPGLQSLRSVQSVSTLFSSRASTLAPSIRSSSTLVSTVSSVRRSPVDSASTTFEGAGTATSQPSLSVLFSPHGLAYPSLRSYVAAHLIPAQALPLTALLHCFDAVSNPWWLGGNICAGFPAGREVATRLRARAWVSAHDGDKLMKGWGTTMLKTRRYLPGEMMALAGDGEGGSNGAGNGHVPVMDGEGKPKAERRRTQEAGAENGPRQDMTCPPASLRGTEILALGIGEEVVLTRDGVRNPSARADKVDGESGLTGQPECRTERLADLVQSSTTVTAV